jgi:FkbM family methyltransferase
LKTNIELNGLNGNITPIQKAVYEGEENEVKLSNNITMSCISLDGDFEDASDYFSVPTVQLWTLFREHNVLSYERILIKVDVEGYEHPLMSELMRLLGPHRDFKIICEILPNSDSKWLLMDEAGRHGLNVLQIDSSNYLFASRTAWRVGA